MTHPYGGPGFISPKRIAAMLETGSTKIYDYVSVRKDGQWLVANRAVRSRLSKWLDQHAVADDFMEIEWGIDWSEVDCSIDDQYGTQIVKDKVVDVISSLFVELNSGRYEIDGEDMDIFDELFPENWKDRT